MTIGARRVYLPAWAEWFNRSYVTDFLVVPRGGKSKILGNSSIPVGHEVYVKHSDWVVQ